MLTGIAYGYWYGFREYKEGVWREEKKVSKHLELISTFFCRLYLVFNKEIYAHFFGVFIFCLGTFIYSVVMLRLCEESHPHLSQLHFSLELFLFLSSGMLVLAFAIVWFNEEVNHQHKKKVNSETMIAYEDPNQAAYIIEHLAYISFLLFYASFFLFHTPDLRREPFVDGVFRGERETVGMHTLNPLVPPA